MNIQVLAVVACRHLS